MTKTEISEKIRQFIFEQIDSVELLEVLLFVRSQKDKDWNAELLAHEMRSSANSVSRRLENLKRLGLVQEDGADPNLYRYHLRDPELEVVLEELNDTYKVKKQKILELIFSPLKKGRHFANAFVVNPPKKDGEDSDG